MSERLPVDFGFRDCLGNVAGVPQHILTEELDAAERFWDTAL
ncbi:hypothetical protein QLQ12_00890 [Actinoplanes sp. NEAU-A12]|uniref:Uncharacterized protein n=1 Tax=Actinoplanes sandaracinus TaxID=3045177 RepID=A0ABT6WBT9_9ACTN|nr:hypothetical protein [Actinoplanes sandaracinus]MDI6097164.1 hypothetical protein [Actinoplanes sandaracinus]